MNEGPISLGSLQTLLSEMSKGEFVFYRWPAAPAEGFWYMGWMVDGKVTIDETGPRWTDSVIARVMEMKEE